jgi:hypothetical protein
MNKDITVHYDVSAPLTTTAVTVITALKLSRQVRKQFIFETQIPYLSVKAKIAGQEVRLLVDSGTGGLLVYRNRLRAAPEQLHVDPNASISTPAGGGTHVRWFSTEVSLEKSSLGTHNVAIADVDSDPQDDFDGLFGLATMGFRKVSFDFENGLFGWTRY